MDGIRPQMQAQAHSNAGNIALAQGDLDGAQALQERALALLRTIDPDAAKLGTAHTLNRLGIIAMQQGDLDRAEALLAEALERFRALDDKDAVATVLNNLGVIAYDRGDFARARNLYAEALALERDLGAISQIALCLSNLGGVAERLGDLPGAMMYQRESLEIYRVLKDRWNATSALEGVALLALVHGRAEAAARLLGAADGFREAVGAVLAANERADHERAVTAAGEALGAAAFTAAWDAGRLLSLDEAIAEALAMMAKSTGADDPNPTLVAG
jgi:tetratricopeptide (TPR) repeat protein